jgi:hypothetical protein
MTTIVDGKPAILVLSTKPVVLPLALGGITVYTTIIGKAKLMFQTAERSYEVRTRSVMQRPTPSGVNISSSLLEDPNSAGLPTNGTLGLVLHKGTDTYILSNNHVIGQLRAQSVLRPFGSPIYQPNQWFSAEDCKIAELSGRAPQNTDEYLDFAWAKVTNNSLVSDHIRGFQSLNTTRYLENSTESNIGITVGKSGMASANTLGVVVGTDASAVIQLPTGPITVGHDCIVVGNLNDTEFCISGDSGSAVIAPDGSFVGLLFASFVDNNGKTLYTLVIKTRYILQYMGTQFYYVQHVPTIISEPTIPGMPAEIPKNLSPGLAISPGSKVDSLTPTLTWSAVLEASYYSVVIWKNAISNPDGTWSGDVVWNGSPTANSVTVPNGILIPNTAYMWSVMAWGTNGSTDLSSSLYFQTGIVDLPTGLLVNIGDSVQVNLNYSYVGPAATGYTLHAAFGQLNESVFVELFSVDKALNPTKCIVPTIIQDNVVIKIPYSIVSLLSVKSLSADSSSGITIDFQFKIISLSGVKSESNVYKSVIIVSPNAGLFSQLIIISVTK